MGKKQAVLMLVVLLLALLGGAWVVMTKLQTTSHAQTTPEPLAVFHSSVDGEEVYFGELPVEGCRTFGSGISAVNGTPPRITLMLIVEASSSCASEAKKPMTFEVSLGSSSTTPVLDSVLINGASVPFVLREKTPQ